MHFDYVLNQIFLQQNTQLSLSNGLPHVIHCYKTCKKYCLNACVLVNAGFILDQLHKSSAQMLLKV